MSDRDWVGAPRAPAGFYSDPNVEASERWWDGDTWTDVTRPRSLSKGPARRWNWARIANFSSRARRCEFWAAIGIAAASSFIGALLDYWYLGEDGALFSVAAILVWFWLVWGSATNRFHDIGKSGWLALLFLIPFVNFFMVIWIGTQEGEPNTNRWGSPIA